MAPSRSPASISHASAPAPDGTVTSHVIARDSPGASVAARGSSAAPRPSTRARATTSIVRAAALRSVTSAPNRSPARTNGGSPASSIRSSVVRSVAAPVPKRPVPLVATATTRKLVSESLSGISTVASPRSSSATRAFQ